MMLRRGHRVVAMGLAIGFSLLIDGVALSGGGAEKVQKLILQLGSDQFSERLEAMRQLDALGPEALVDLQNASRSQDPEIRRRSAELSEKIEKRILSAKLLEPKKIHLVYKDTPLAQAIDDFAKKTGYTIRYQRDQNHVNRTVILDTGKVPFWDGWELFCRKADVMDRSLSPGYSTRFALGELDRRKEQEIRMLLMEESMLGINGNYPVPFNSMTLVDGSAPLLPACRSGAVRIQALPPELSSVQAPVKEDEFRIVLDITPEPKLAWRKVIDVRIDQAIDNRNEPVAAVADSSLATSDYELELRTRIMINGKSADQELIASSLRQYPVRFKYGKDKPARLKVLKGTVAAQVNTAPEALVTIDSIFQSVGKTIQGKDGLMVTLNQVEADRGGSVRVQMEVQTPAPFPGGDGIMKVRGMRMVRVGGAFVESSGLPSPGNFAFLDSKGTNISLNRISSNSTWKGNEVVQSYSLAFQQPKSGAGPVKFVYTGSRTVVIDVPFVLEDVPVH